MPGQGEIFGSDPALDRLLGQLADVPTPAGPTPREISTPAQATLLPIIEINRRPTWSGRATAEWVPHEFWMGVAEIDAVLIKSVGNVEAARVEDELHSEGAGGHVAT